jgi:hypothetical protein
VGEATENGRYKENISVLLLIAFWVRGTEGGCPPQRDLANAVCNAMAGVEDREKGFELFDASVFDLGNAERSARAVTCGTRYGGL